MASIDTKLRVKVAALLLEGGDLLDLVGPFEMFSGVSHNEDLNKADHAISIDCIGTKEIVRLQNGFKVARDFSIEEAIAKIDDYDILVVPGGPPAAMEAFATTGTPELAFVKEFLALPQRPGKMARIAFSVCTGAYLLGAAGGFKNKTATTHFMCLDDLKRLCGESTNVIRERYVDAGELENGTKVISAAGVSSGMDASLYLIQNLFSLEAAKTVASVAEYDWRKTE